MTTINKPPVNRIVVYQLVITGVITLLVQLIEKDLALSVLLGALVQIGPQAYFNRMAYRYTGARQSSRVLRGFYQGESGKLVLTAALFAIVFSRFPDLNYPAVFLSYLVMIVVHSMSAILVLKK